MRWFSRKPSEFDTMMQLLKSVPLDKWVLSENRDNPEITFGKIQVRGVWDSGWRDLRFLAYIDISGSQVGIHIKQRREVGNWLMNIYQKLVSMQVLNQLKEDNNGVV